MSLSIRDCIRALSDSDIAINPRTFSPGEESPGGTFSTNLQYLQVIKLRRVPTATLPPPNRGAVIEYSRECERDSDCTRGIHAFSAAASLAPARARAFVAHPCRQRPVVAGGVGHDKTPADGLTELQLDKLEAEHERLLEPRRASRMRSPRALRDESDHQPPAGGWTQRVDAEGSRNACV